MSWRFLLTPPASGVENMALDEALRDRARATGEGVVRVYSWHTPTISLGRNQRARGAYDPDRAASAGLDVVRRITGGRALLHHREITYSVTAPVCASESLRDSYAAINALLRTALASLGVAASVAGRSERLSAPGLAPCFELPAEGELTFNARKLVGSAQVREDGAYLQHGSLLLRDDQHRLADAAMAPIALAPAATVHDALGRDVTPAVFADALFDAVRATWDADGTELPLDEALRSDAAARQPRYASTDWTWRR